MMSVRIKIKPCKRHLRPPDSDFYQEDILNGFVLAEEDSDSGYYKYRVMGQPNKYWYINKNFVYEIKV